MAGTTFDPATISAVTLSGGNLVVTNTGTTSTNQGAKSILADAKTSGKFYFEVTLTNFAGGAGVGVGIGTPASTYANMSTLSTHGDMAFAVGHTGSGPIWTDTNNTGLSLGARSTGDVIGIAVNLNAGFCWFRVSPSGLWDGSSSHDPTNTTFGGMTLPTGYATSGLVPFVTFGSSFSGAAGVSGNVLTANFGDSAFTGAVPSGYTSGWPSGVITSAAQAIFFRSAF